MKHADTWTDGKRQQTSQTGANAFSEIRTALVIGNSTYKDAPLKNPVNDAKEWPLCSKNAVLMSRLNWMHLKKRWRKRSDYLEGIWKKTAWPFFYAGPDKGLSFEGTKSWPDFIGQSFICYKINWLYKFFWDAYIKTLGGFCKTSSEQKFTLSPTKNILADFSELIFPADHL